MVGMWCRSGFFDFTGENLKKFQKIKNHHTKFFILFFILFLLRLTF